MSREEFLARVRQAAQMGRSYRVPTQEAAPQCGYVGADEEDLCSALATQVRLVGGSPHLVETWAEAQSKLSKLLEEFSPASVLAWSHRVLERVQAAKSCADRDVAYHDVNSLRKQNAPDRRATMLAADLGVTSVDVAVAETGSLLLCSTLGQEREASLLPPIHVAVVACDQIVPDLVDALKYIEENFEGNPPSNMVFVTGPSKTGDIELQLTTGVHGPGIWRVIIVREPQ